MTRLALLFIVSSVCLSATRAQSLTSASTAPHSHEVQSTESIYKTVGNVPLKLQIFTNGQQTKNRPAVVFFFGGGWRAGSPSQFEPHCRYLASRGLLAATADYRVASRHSVTADACVEDAKSAVRWLRQNASRLGIDPHRICAAGGSAGGHIACCTAAISGLEASDEDQSVSSRPNALALFNPALMLAPLEGFEFEFPADRSTSLARRTGVPPADISPIHHIRADLPPTIIFHGEADTTVPIATVKEYERRATAAGNACEVVSYANAPHGFFNAAKGNNAARRDQSDQWYRRTVYRLDTFLNRLGWLHGPPTVRVVDRDFVYLRGRLTNSQRKFASGTGHVAFLGGSITEMEGYRPMVCQWLKKQFPDTDFQFTNAGIASTCSHTGAFRLERDVLSHGTVDLLFVEFAVNDDQDAAHSAKDCIAGMEGIIRRVRRHNPEADIVMTHFVNPGMLKTLEQGERIKSASAHEDTAVHYGVSSVFLPKVLSRMIERQQMTWKQFGGTHPGPVGNQLAADCATAVLQAGWSGRQAAASAAHPLPADLLNDDAFTTGRLVSGKDSAGGEWSYSEPDWATLPGGKRSRYLSRPLLHCTTPGAATSLDWSGTAVGVFVLAGPDAGQLEFRIDDGPWQTRDLYHRFSRGLHYPRTVILGSGLPDREHRLEIRVGQEKHTGSKGHAIRILDFAVN
ncbi:MAG: alpha/beta hydrolase fold domain-containing protein [Planctomycetaceae bacterium]|nr:alpha/beta hydrolase fold domain-containing protein [Planctomycetaceae bacterium]